MCTDKSNQIEEHKVAAKKLNQEIEEERAKVTTLQKAHDELLRRLAEAEQMLVKTDGHKLMTDKIIQQFDKLPVEPLS